MPRCVELEANPNIFYGMLANGAKRAKALASLLIECVKRVAGLR
jgi:hypothetical protein